MTDTKRRLDLRINEDLAAYANDRAYRTQRTISEVVEEGLTVGAPETFPGYYTMHTLRDGEIEGMLSVNAVTGEVWGHSWHGAFVAMSEDG